MPPSQRFQMAHGYKKPHNTWMKICAVGLCLCLSLWAMSYLPFRRADTWGTISRRLLIWSSRDELSQTRTLVNIIEGTALYNKMSLGPSPSVYEEHDFDCFLFEITWWKYSKPYMCHDVVVYFWRIALLFAVPLLYGLSRRGYRHYVGLQRRANFQCVGCGYSLRGLTTPVCPECGTVFDPRLLQPLQSQCQPQKPDSPGL